MQSFAWNGYIFCATRHSYVPYFDHLQVRLMCLKCLVARCSFCTIAGTLYLVYSAARHDNFIVMQSTIYYINVPVQTQSFEQSTSKQPSPRIGNL